VFRGGSRLLKNPFQTAAQNSAFLSFDLNLNMFRDYRFYRFEASVKPLY